MVIRFLSRLLLCHCRPAEGELPALAKCYLRRCQRGQDLRWCTVLICSHTTVLLSPPSLWRSAISELSSQTMGIENAVIKRQKSAGEAPAPFLLSARQKNKEKETQPDNLTAKMETLLALARQWPLITAISISAAFSCELYLCTVD